MNGAAHRAVRITSKACRCYQDLSKFPRERIGICVQYGFHARSLGQVQNSIAHCSEEWKKHDTFVKASQGAQISLGLILCFFLRHEQSSLPTDVTMNALKTDKSENEAPRY